MGCICHRIKGLLGRVMVVLVLLSFSGMAGYSTLLHNHDLDFGHSHDDCASCQWTQSHKTNNDTSTAETPEAPSIQAEESHASRLNSQTVHSGFYSRGPPTLS